MTGLTEVVERHRGVVFQYTGDGLLALFLAELAGLENGPLVDRLVTVVVPETHAAFDAQSARWRADWRASGRRVTRVGLGTGLSFGRATIGFMGPSGKKHVGVIGEPVNVAAFLCSQAPPGALLVDRGAFTRAGATVPLARVIRVRSKKPHQRIEAVFLRCGGAAGST